MKPAEYAYVRRFEDPNAIFDVRDGVQMVRYVEPFTATKYLNKCVQLLVARDFCFPSGFEAGKHVAKPIAKLRR
jgi:hypothetical protein